MPRKRPPGPRADRPGAPRGALGPARARRARTHDGERRSFAALSSHRGTGRDAPAELYVQGEPDPLAVILGATSLDEAMAGIEGLARATAPNERLATRGRTRRAAARVAEQQTGRLATRAWTAPAAPPVGADRLARRRRQAETIATAGSGALTKQRLAALERGPPGAAALGDDQRRQSRGDGCRASVAQPGDDAAAPTPSPTPRRGHAHARRRRRRVSPPGPHGERPAGRQSASSRWTRADPARAPGCFIPGYGPAVAADVGSAVKGNIIDLWMPSHGEGARLGAAHRHDHRSTVEP